MPFQKKQNKTWLTVWLLTPFVIVASLYLAFPKDAAHSLANRARSQQLAAGEAVTQVTADRLAQGFIVRVQDRTGRSAAEGPVYLRTTRQADLLVMTREEGGWWEIMLPFTRSDTPLTYAFVLGTQRLPALDEAGHQESPHAPPAVNPTAFTGDKRPRAEHVVVKWLEAAVKPGP